MSFGRAGLGDVVDAEPAAEGRVAVLALALVIDDHDVVGDAHLVGMPARRQIDPREHLGMARIGDVDDGRARRLAHMPDIEDMPVDPDLAAAGAIEIRQQLGVLRARHEGDLSACLFL